MTSEQQLEHLTQLTANYNKLAIFCYQAIKLLKAADPVKFMSLQDVAAWRSRQYDILEKAAKNTNNEKITADNL